MAEEENIQSSNSNKFLTRKDKVILWVGHFILICFLILIIIPLLYVLACSFTNPADRNSLGFSVDLSKWTLEGYKRIMSDNNIWRGFRNSFFYSTCFCIISVGVTIMAAYPLSRRDFMGGGFFHTFFIITMFFGGGMMPTYLLVSQLNMIDTVWSILLPGAVNVWNIILTRSYYKSIPAELREASLVDGASDMQHFFKILLPVCKPIVAVLVLYQFVAQWNSYFDAMIYLNSNSLQPLQLVLRSILVQNQINPAVVQDSEKVYEAAKLAALLKYSTIVVSSVPLIIMYPFFSKYFEKGILVGSVKG